MMTQKQFTGWKNNEQSNASLLSWHWREEREQLTRWLKFSKGELANPLEYQNNHTKSLNRLSRYTD
jgi:hypothetical protein